MIVDKPPWVTHGAAPIFSIDIDSKGERVATAGADNRVRIWSLKPILDDTAELNKDTPRLLSTLEHSGAANVVRFAQNGKQLASGSDDKVVAVYELRPGRGHAVFGSNEAPSIENWKQIQAMRGHDNNVTDLCWSPDGSMLASASLDNMVIIWEAATGQRIKKLEGHVGFVKGVAWDPHNVFLASQGEQDGICIWRVDDWSCVKKITAEELKAQLTAASFHSRLAWSPDGQTLLCMNGRDPPEHIVPCVMRHHWRSENSFVGHRAAVVAARFNPKFFYSRKEGEEDVVCQIVALGSSDKKFTVWNPGEPTPLFIGERFFAGGVMDMAWTPDGYTLLACSYDGTITRCHFTEKELGKVASDKDVGELLEKYFGDPNKRNRALLAGAELLEFENDAMDQDQPEEPAPAAAAAAAAAAPAAPAAPAATAAPVPAPPAATGPSSGSSAAAANKRADAFSKLSSRLGPGGSGFLPSTSSAAAAAAAPAAPAAPAAAAATAPPPAPPEIRRRVAPTSLAGAGPSTSAAAAAPRAPASPARPSASRLDGPPSKRQAVPAASGAAAPAAGAAPGDEPAAAGGAAGTAAAGPLLPPIVPQRLLQLQLYKQPSTQDPSIDISVELEVNNMYRDFRGDPSPQVVCHAEGRQLWYDHVQGYAVQACGTAKFVAVSTSNDDLQVYSACGRRLFPPIRLGSTTAFMSTDGGWRLMVICVDGSLRLWDMQLQSCTLETSVAPLMGPKDIKPGAVRVSGNGAPIIVLTNFHSYTYHPGMKAWMRIADDSFPSSQYHSSFNVSGDLGRAQADIASRRVAREVFASSAAPRDWQARATRAHLEVNVASALALQSGAEWRRWLLTYVRQLAADQDEARLREVVAELMGPLRWSPATHRDEGGRGWQPVVLGVDKRRLLRQDVLKEISRHRSAGNQRLVQEVLDLLKEVETNGAGGAGVMGAAAGGGQHQQQQQHALFAAGPAAAAAAAPAPPPAAASYLQGVPAAAAASGSGGWQQPVQQPVQQQQQPQLQSQPQQQSMQQEQQQPVVVQQASAPLPLDAPPPPQQQQQQPAPLVPAPAPSEAAAAAPAAAVAADSAGGGAEDTMALG